MTLKELLEVAPLNICAIEVTVRDKGKKLDEYHISPIAQEDRHPMFNHSKGKEEPRWICIKKPINHKDIGKDYWGIFVKNIPKELINKSVTYFDVRNGWWTNNGLNEHRRMIVDVAGTDTCILEAPKEKRIKNDGQIEGQMCLELEEVKL